jgi:hypothetical protein
MLVDAEITSGSHRVEPSGIAFRPVLAGGMGGDRELVTLRRGRVPCAALAPAVAIGLTAGSVSAHPGDFIRHIAWTSSTPAPGLELLTGTFTDPTVHPSRTVTVERAAADSIEIVP